MASILTSSGFGAGCYPPARIEELLEGRKPKEACILAKRPGTARVVTDDDVVELAVIEDDGGIEEYPLLPGQNPIVFDGQRVGVAEPLTDGPANPHEILEVFFQVLKEQNPTFEAALESFQQVQTFLVNEVQSVYQSQGVDISDKHIEVIVPQMTNKVRMEDVKAQMKIDNFVQLPVKLFSSKRLFLLQEAPLENHRLLVPALLGSVFEKAFLLHRLPRESWITDLFLELG
jgi:hypothetical protein